MMGLGDNVYQRPAIRAFHEARGTPVYLRTPWPQLYHDMPFVRCVRPETGLRTQAINVGKSDFVPAPRAADKIRLGYRPSDFDAGLSPPEVFNAQLRVDGRDFYLPWEAEKKPIAVVHPPTVRTEWYNAARPNDPKYMQRLIDNHPEFHWVAVGWVDPPHEAHYGEPLRVDEEYMRGELSTNEMITMIASAQVFVTCVSYGLPLGIALRVPTLCLWGGDVGPELLRKDWMGLDHYEECVPDPFCSCYRHRHRNGECNKVLTDVEEKFQCLIGA